MHEACRQSTLEQSYLAMEAYLASWNRDSMCEFFNSHYYVMCICCIIHMCPRCDPAMCVCVCNGSCELHKSSLRPVLEKVKSPQYGLMWLMISSMWLTVDDEFPQVFVESMRP